jgi:hypothetical protein
MTKFLTHKQTFFYFFNTFLYWFIYNIIGINRFFFIFLFLVFIL